jgi:RimJ/RimL family protein N-acetyltransferase
MEAAQATLQQARSLHGLARVVAITTPDNASSQRVLERLGFRFERTMRLAPDAAPVNLYAA